MQVNIVRFLMWKQLYTSIVLFHFATCESWSAFVPLVLLIYPPSKERDSALWLPGEWRHQCSAEIGQWAHGPADIQATFCRSFKSSPYSPAYWLTLTHPCLAYLLRQFCSSVPACPRMAVIFLLWDMLLFSTSFFSHLFASSLKSSSSDGSQSSSLYHFLQIQQLFLIFTSQFAFASI